MDPDRLRELRAITARNGFICGDERYAEGPAMTKAVRELEVLDEREQATYAQGRGLLENLRRVIVGTALATNPIEPLRRQSRLHRWMFLRQVSPEAADAYAEVLRYFGITPPEWLLPGHADD